MIDFNAATKNLILQSVQVLHLREYKKKALPEGHKNPLRAFHKATRPFTMEDCARHIYLFPPGLPAEQIEDLVDNIKPNCSHCEHLTGTHAYHFMLRWATGYESPKFNHNDPYTISEIRKTWTGYQV